MWGGSRAVWKRRFSCYGPWETVESCVVRGSASVYRRLQENPPGRGGNGRGPPLTPGSPSPASGRLLKSESEDSGVELPSTEHSPTIPPPASQSGFTLDGFSPKNPPGEERDPEPPRPPRSRSVSRKGVQGAQRSRRQRCPRHLWHRSSSSTELRAEPRDLEAPTREHPHGTAVPELGVPVPGQGLRYLEHVCQMLERLARLQQDNRLLRQQAEQARNPRPDTAPTREVPGPDREVPGPDRELWRPERFRPRSCSDSQAPVPDPPGLCRRMWGGHSASSPSLLDPWESGLGSPAPGKDGRSPWGRVKVLLTRLTRRSLRGGRCR
ncbi:uncharacterized protein C8orf58 homolog [Heliangelus exortis]|uniref:uncharacterized protein C8orf58 homolog n=1 Tax=Heliangelus exortis TaxID=472823 RepID=UPI003A941022